MKTYTDHFFVYVLCRVSYVICSIILVFLVKLYNQHPLYIVVMLTRIERDTLAFFNNIKNIRDRLADENSIKDINTHINGHEELRNLRDNINRGIDERADKESRKQKSEREFYNSLTAEEKIEYNRRKRKEQNLKRLGMYGAGLVTAGIGIGIPILMAAGTWDILNDDSMTISASEDNSEVVNDSGITIGVDEEGNSVAYGTLDFDEDDYSETAVYMVEDDEGNITAASISDFDEDGYAESLNYTEVSIDGTALSYDEFDFDEDGWADLEIEAYLDENGNYVEVGVYDSDGDHQADMGYVAEYDDEGNIVSEDYYEDVDGDGVFDVHF